MNEDRLGSISALLSVADERNFGLAARKLGVTQSTISRRVAQLEARLGVRLVARTTRSVSLTSAGEAYVRQARAALRLLGAAEADLAAGDDNVAGLVRIAAPTAFGRACVVPALNDLCRAHSSLRVELDLEDRYADLSSAGVDLALRFASGAPSGWTVEPLGEVGAALCASPSYLASHGQPDGTEALARHPLLAVKTYGPRTRWAFRVDGVRREVDIDPVVLVSDFVALTDMVVAGVGLSILPTFIAHPLIASGCLVEVLDGSVDFRATIVASRPVHLEKVARVQAVINAVRSRLRGVT